MVSNRFLLIVTLATLLGGCGGGGGGGGGSGSGTSGTIQPPSLPAPAPAVSGLVPVAPAVGATLYASAASLRVLRAGAV